MLQLECLLISISYYTHIDIMLFLIVSAVAVGYVTLLSRLLVDWDHVPEWRIPSGYDPTTKISILIAARNEEENIRRCLQSIINNNYIADLLEIIVVDDHSDDKTKKEILSIDYPKIKYLLNNGQGKKAAITRGIRAASNDLIITTDADCEVASKWLRSIVSFYEASGARFIAGPIQYEIDKSLIKRFQYMDAMNSVSVTAGGISNKSFYMANGANMAYEKTLFEEIGGFDSSSNLASGDDMFLIQEAAKLDKSKVKFLKSKEALVKTEAESSWKNLLIQRKRWSTKTKAYQRSKLVKIQGYVFFFSLLLLLSLLLPTIGVSLGIFAFVFGLFIKLSIDYLYLARLAEFFVAKDGLKSFIPASLIYLVYILIAGWWALIPSKYTWKGRKTS